MIYPANKQDVGLRLARLALANDYGKLDVMDSGPLYKSKKIYDNYIDFILKILVQVLNKKIL